MSKNKSPQPPQVSLLLRLLGGGYLVYLAYDLIKTVPRTFPYIAICVCFALVGAGLLIFSGRALILNEYFYDRPEDTVPEEEVTEEESE